MRVTIPWKHVASSNQRHARRGGRAHSWQYKRAKEAIHLHALNQIRGERPHYPVGTLHASIACFPPDARKRDVTNLPKGILDALEGVMYDNDAQVVSLHVWRAEVDRDEPRVEVDVVPLNGAVRSLAGGDTPGEAA